MSSIPIDSKVSSLRIVHDCAVCRSKAIGINFGAATCAPCKGSSVSDQKARSPRRKAFLFLFIETKSFFPTERSTKRSKNRQIFCSIDRSNIFQRISDRRFAVSISRSPIRRRKGKIENLFANSSLHVLSDSSMLQSRNENRVDPN